MRADAAILPLELSQDFLNAALNGGFAHGLGGIFCLQMVFPFGRKDPSRVSMSLPILSHRDQSRFGKGDVAILGSLSTVDVNEHASGIDIFDLKMKSFLEPESEHVDDGKEAEHRRLLDDLQEDKDFRDRKDDRQFQLRLDAHELQDRPIARASELKEPLDPVLSDVDGTWLPLELVLDVEQVVSDIVLGSRVGITLKKLGEFSDSSSVGFLSSFGESIKLEVLLEPDEDRRKRVLVFRHDDVYSLE
jgi:hypothetical protein